MTMTVSSVSGQPYPSLQGLKITHLLYIGATACKTIYPSQELPFIVPKPLFSPLRIVAAELYRGGHLLEQKPLAEFIRKAIMKRIFAVCACSMVNVATFLVSLIQRYLGPEFIHMNMTKRQGFTSSFKLPNFG